MTVHRSPAWKPRLTVGVQFIVPDRYNCDIIMITKC